LCSQYAVSPFYGPLSHFSLFVEFIRIEHLMLWGLTGYQLACIVGIIYVYRDVWLKFGAKTVGRET
jgi:hypothetical protein